MAVAVNNIIRIAEVCSYINSNVRDYIQGNIKYHRGNIPTGWDRGSEFFGTYRTLKGLDAGSVGGVNSIINFKQLYAQLQIVFIDWALVRYISFSYTYGFWTNGRSNHTTTINSNGYALLSHLPSSVNVNLGSDLTGQIIRASTISTFMSQLRSAWANLASAYSASYSRYVCHSDCHDDCHGSGGRR